MKFTSNAICDLEYYSCFVPIELVDQFMPIVILDEYLKNRAVKSVM